MELDNYQKNGGFRGARKALARFPPQTPLSPAFLKTLTASAMLYPNGIFYPHLYPQLFTMLYWVQGEREVALHNTRLFAI